MLVKWSASDGPWVLVMTFAANTTFYLFVYIAIYLATGDSGQCTHIHVYGHHAESLSVSLTHTMFTIWLFGSFMSMCEF